MSIAFLVVVLFILVLLVFILAFREPLAKLALPINPSTSASTSPAGNQVSNGSSSPRSSGKPLVVDGGTVTPSPVIVSPSPTASAVASSLPDAKSSPIVTSTPKSTEPAAVNPGGAKTSPVPVAAKTDGAADLKSVTLYFARVSDEGQISIEKVSRSVGFTESPLVSSIRALLKGPAGNELSQGVVSMIPAGTTLLKAWVQDSVAYLNFSESFMFNPLGGDGLRAQVRQVVWVATEFPTVKSVQILIEGKKVPYLGGDNVAVGMPLTRKSLP